MAELSIRVGDLNFTARWEPDAPQTIGAIRRLVEGPLEAGDYRLEFVVDGPFFRLLAVSFRVDDPSRSYHVPLIVAPYSLATYRGS